MNIVAAELLHTFLESLDWRQYFAKDKYKTPRITAAKTELLVCFTRRKREQYAKDQDGGTRPEDKWQHTIGLLTSSRIGHNIHVDGMVTYRIIGDN